MPPFPALSRGNSKAISEGEKKGVGAKGAEARMLRWWWKNCISRIRASKTSSINCPSAFRLRNLGTVVEPGAAGKRALDAAEFAACGRQGAECGEHGVVWSGAEPGVGGEG